MPDRLDRILRREKTAWTAFIASYTAQTATLFEHTPTGLEQLLDNPTGDIIGKAALLGGIAYGVYSILFTRHRSREGLITDGPYNTVRNPIYLGFRLSSLGAMIYNPFLETLIAGAAVLVTTEITARMEERTLLALYGSEFEEYRAGVPRWMPYGRHVGNRAKKLGKCIASIFGCRTPIE